MGYDEQALQEGDGALIEQLLAVVGRDAGTELARAGTVRLYAEPRVQFADGFPTPSGRIELASAAAEADGHPRLPEPSVDEPAPLGYLRLLSPASPWLMNATFGNDRKLRHRIGPASVALHPREAAGTRPAQGRSRDAAQRHGRAAAGGRDQRCRAARRGLCPEGPLALARARGRERQRAQSGLEDGHGRELRGRTACCVELVPG